MHLVVSRWSVNCVKSSFELRVYACQDEVVQGRHVKSADFTQPQLPGVQSVPENDGKSTVVQLVAQELETSHSSGFSKSCAA